LGTEGTVFACLQSLVSTKEITGVHLTPVMREDDSHDEVFSCDHPHMRMGLTIPTQGMDLRDLPELARRAEAAGYESLWSAEATEHDGFTPLAIAATATSRVRLVTGIVSVYTRGPALLAQSAAALSQLSGGRFTLGLGASSNVIVQEWNGIRFERPLAKVRATVEYLRHVLDGERGAGGFRLASPPGGPVAIVLAALRDRMLALAAEIADGAFTNFLPLSDVSRVVEAFDAPEKELACRFFSVPGPDDEALAVAKRVFLAYATVPVYTEFFRWLGHDEEVDPVVRAWQDGDRRLAVELAPEALVREIFLLGPLEAQRERLQAFAEAGIDTAVPLVLGSPADAARAVEAFAPG
jgi:probable F420-dependent oxidoreductase